jgi:hypothetical protein
LSGIASPGSGRIAASRLGPKRSPGLWGFESCRSGRGIRKRKGSWNESTATWKRRSCGGAFVSAPDFNTQLVDWLAKANTSLVRPIHARPVDRIGVDRAATLSLPPVAPVTGLRSRIRRPGDYYVRADSNDYSVHPEAIGHLVDVSATLGQVRVFLAGREVAVHSRSWADRLTITDPAHKKAAARLRKDYGPRPLERPSLSRLSFGRCRTTTTCSTPAVGKRWHHDHHKNWYRPDRA